MNAYNTIFSPLPNTSRVWIYQNQEPISKENQALIQQKLDEFVASWAAHEVPLLAKASILEDYFIVLVVNEEITVASGCSIDTSVHFIKELEKTFQLKLFDRLHVLIEDNNTKKIVPFSDIQHYKGSFLFDPTITHLGDFRERWKKQL